MPGSYSQPHRASGNHRIWIANLQRLMQEQDLNPRSLSVKAGLNPTAVRDMLECRSNSPRYNTVRAIAAALNTTPADLMEGRVKVRLKRTDFKNTELLTNIIEVLLTRNADENRKSSPREFAIEVISLYRHMATNTPAREPLKTGQQR